MDPVVTREQFVVAFVDTYIRLLDTPAYARAKRSFGGDLEAIARWCDRYFHWIATAGVGSVRLAMRDSYVLSLTCRSLRIRFPDRLIAILKEA